MSDYLADLPLEDPADDRFGRAPFAARIAETLVGRKGSEPLVIGIYGRWGSGKTTVLNFIRRALDDPEEVVYVTFNPWLFSTTEQLLVEFFTLVATALEKRLTTPLEQLGGLLTKLGRAASGLSVTAGASLDPGALMGGVGGLLAGVQASEMRERVSKALRDEGKRVVILIDDVDRLDVEETYLLFRLIKLVADFDNTTYILAFDEQVVAAALSRRYPEQQRFGEGFVEKIVQVPLHLPPARLDLVHRVVFEGIDELFTREDISLETEDVVRYRTAFDAVGLDMDTPRSAARYLNALQFAVPMVKGEVDLVDLLLLEAIRATTPTVYQWVSRKKTLLTEPPLSTTSSTDDERAELDEGVAGLLPSHATRMRKVVSALFPKAEGLWSAFHMGGGDEEALAKGKRLASSEYFDRYFLYTVPSDDVADAEISRLIELAEAEDPQLPEALAALTTPPKSERVIAKLRQRREQLSPATIAHLVTALASIGANLDFGWRGVFALSTGEQAALLTRDLIQHLPDPHNRAELGEAFIRAAQPLEFAVEGYRWMSTSSDGSNLVDDEATVRFRNLLATRVLAANGADPLFLSNPEWAARFYLLTVESELAQELREELRSQVVDGASAVAFLRAFMTPARDLQTGRRSVYLDENAFEAATLVMELELLEEPLAQVSGDDSGSAEAEMSRDDMTEADDGEVAEKFMRITRRRRARQTTQSSGEGGSDGTETAAPS